MNSIAALAASAALAGCGNYSTEDLRFLAALPRGEDLRVAVPAEGQATGLASCAAGTATVWLEAKPTSDRLNAGVDLVVSLIDRVRRIPPTAREEDARRWGPFDDEKHPGREIQVLLSRTYPPALGGAPAHDYWFQARVKGTDAFTDVLWGRFEGASASHGRGDVVLDFDAFWALQMNDETTPRGRMQIAYDRASEPVTIGLSLTQEGFGVPQFAYAYAGYRDGSGAFDYRFRNDEGDVLTVATIYDPGRAGWLRAVFTTAAGWTGSFGQCWDGSACLVYVEDPGDYSCPAADQPCSSGAIEACTTTAPGAPLW